MLTSIETCGRLISDAAIAGERKADGYFPSHISGLLLAHDRWMILYSTRGVRGHDDEHSIMYQIRADCVDGPVLREGVIDQGCDDWEPYGDGRKLVRRTFHPMAFGVPEGAIIHGKTPSHAGVFAAQWCVEAAGELDHATGNVNFDAKCALASRQVMWSQFRLSASRDDIQWIQPAQRLRQVGYESGDAFCSRVEARSMIQSLVPALPFNDDCTQWAMTNHPDTGVAAVKFRFNLETGLYEWVETGPAIPTSDQYAFSEGALVRMDDRWIVCVRARRLNAAPPDWSGGTARDRGDTGWAVTDDPFTQMPAPEVVQVPNRQAPVTAFRCADGKLRMFSGDFDYTQKRQRRDPLFCWDVDPDDFTVSNQQIVFDSVKAGAFVEDGSPEKLGTLRSCCFGHVFPHAGGDAQSIAHRLLCFRYRKGVEPNGPAITSKQFDSFGVYHEKLRYDKSYPAVWEFEGADEQ